MKFLWNELYVKCFLVHDQFKTTLKLHFDGFRVRHKARVESQVTYMQYTFFCQQYLQTHIMEMVTWKGCISGKVALKGAFEMGL